MWHEYNQLNLKAQASVRKGHRNNSLYIQVSANTFYKNKDEKAQSLKHAANSALQSTSTGLDRKIT